MARLDNVHESLELLLRAIPCLLQRGRLCKPLTI